MSTTISSPKLSREGFGDWVDVDGIGWLCDRQMRKHGVVVPEGSEITLFVSDEEPDHEVTVVPLYVVALPYGLAWGDEEDAVDIDNEFYNSLAVLLLRAFTFPCRLYFWIER